MQGEIGNAFSALHADLVLDDMRNAAARLESLEVSVTVEVEGLRAEVTRLEGLPSRLALKKEIAESRAANEALLTRGDGSARDRYLCERIAEVSAENERLRAAVGDISSLEVPLRSGRPEHLTLDAAETHADGLRNANATVVGKLLIVAVDEVRRLREVVVTKQGWLEKYEADAHREYTDLIRLREENATLRAAREGVRAKGAEFGLIVDISDEVLKGCNKQIAALREEFEQATEKHEGAAATHIAQRDQYIALVQQLVHEVDAHSCGPLSHVRMRDCVNAATAVREFEWAIPTPEAQHG